MKYAITVIDDSPESILGRSDDKTEIVIRRRTVVDFEVVQLAAKDAEIAALKETLAKREHLLDEWNEKLTSLREQVERLSAPVSDEEWDFRRIGKFTHGCVDRMQVDKIIAARLEGK